MDKKIQKVEAKLIQINDKGHFRGNGLDIIINHDEASVADYCSEVEEFILAGGYDRERSQVTCCEGCDTCCRERIPLTAVDAFLLWQHAASDLSLTRFLQRYAYVTVDGRVVDIALAQNSSGKCVFLDYEQQKCLHYQARPLVCRSYICTPMSTRARQLRDVLVNSGEDELVRQWCTLDNGKPGPVHEALEPELRQEDWLPGSWSGKTDYRQVLIKDVVSPSLWEKLRKGDALV